MLAGRPAGQPAGRKFQEFGIWENRNFAISKFRSFKLKQIEIPFFSGAPRTARRAEFRGGQNFGVHENKRLEQGGHRPKRPPSGAGVARTMSCSGDQLFSGRAEPRGDRRPSPSPRLGSLFAAWSSLFRPEAAVWHSKPRLSLHVLLSSALLVSF